MAPGGSFLQVWGRLEKGEGRVVRRALLHLGVAEALVASVVTPRMTPVMPWASPLIPSPAFLPCFVEAFATLINVLLSDA